MAAGPFTIGQLDSATNKYYVPGIKDNFRMNKPFFNKLYENKKKFDGGQDIRKTVRVDHAGSGGAWGGGVGTLDATFNENVTQAVFPISNYYASMMVPQTYLWLNKGKAKLTDIMENQSETALQTLNKTLALDLYGAGGLNGSGARKIDGLQAIMTQAADPSYAAFGGITRVGASGSWSSNSGNAFWNSTVFAANANTAITGWAGSETIDALTTVNIPKLQQIVGFGKRDDAEVEMLLMRRNLYNACANLLSTYRRYENSDDQGKMGFKKGLMFENAQIVSDDCANSGEICAVNFKDLQMHVHDEADFFATDFRVPVNQQVLIKYIFLMLSMTSDRPNSLVRVTGFTG